MNRLLFSFICFICLLTTNDLLSQQNPRTLRDRFLVKTNILNLTALGPSIMVEKAVTHNVTIEATFASGKLNTGETDYYKYSGTVLRAKRYFRPITRPKVYGHSSLYIGTLDRTIKESGWGDGWFAWPERYFTGSSFRFGGGVGMTYFAKNNLVLELQASAGYGAYTYANEHGHREGIPDGYLDLQAGIIIGYAF